MKLIYLMLLIFFLPNHGFSQELIDIRIVKILDTNLFLSEEGQFIKLAEVQSPSLFSEDSIIAKKIIKYANNKFVKKPLSYQLPNIQNNEDTLFVYLYREYDFNTICYNEEYLELGFGKYKKSNLLSINNEYLKTEKIARRDKGGIWQKEPVYYPRSHSFIFKYNNKFKEYINDEPVTFRQFIYTLNKPKKIFQFSVTRLFRQYFGVESGKNLDYYFISRIYGNSENTSINFGLGFFTHSGGEGLGGILFPVAGISFRFYDRFYIHSNFADENNLSLWNYGITYKFNHPYTKLTIGRSYAYDFEDEWTYYFIARFSVLNLLQFQALGKYNFNKRFGYFLFGIGFIINE